MDLPEHTNWKLGKTVVKAARYVLLLLLSQTCTEGNSQEIISTPLVFTKYIDPGCNCEVTPYFCMVTGMGSTLAKYIKVNLGVVAKTCHTQPPDFKYNYRGKVCGYDLRLSHDGKTFSYRARSSYLTDAMKSGLQKIATGDWVEVLNIKVINSQGDTARLSDIHVDVR